MRCMWSELPFFLVVLKLQKNKMYCENVLLSNGFEPFEIYRLI